MQEKEAFDIVWNACEGLSCKAFTKLTKELCKVIAPQIEFVRIEEKRAFFRSKAVDLSAVESVFYGVFKEYNFNCCEDFSTLAKAAGFLIETLPNKNSVCKDDFFNPMQSEASCLSAGVPVDQIRILLGHENIQTTLRYALTQQEQVSNSYRSIIEKSL